LIGVPEVQLGEYPGYVHSVEHVLYKGEGYGFLTVAELSAW
jgi:hypothetical protein